MYRQIPWELFADALGSVEHVLGTTGLHEMTCVKNATCIITIIIIIVVVIVITITTLHSR